MSLSSFRRPLIGIALGLMAAMTGGGGAKAATVSPQDCKAAAAGHTQPGPREPRALALLVGVGDYPADGVTAVSKLRGPPNDVEIMRDMLVKKGLTADNIKVLLDKQATRDGIISAFCDHLVNNAGSQDSVLFYFSGHGSQMGDLEPFDEPDGYDETIVAYDSRRSGISDIRDDELQALVRQLPTANVVLILDSCHSGTASKDAFGVARKVDPDPRVPRRQPQGGARAIDPNNGFSSDAARYVLFAGTRADRLSYETEFSRGDRSVTFGAFTYHLVREFEAAKDATYREVFEQIVPQVTAMFAMQKPQLEGTNADNVLFKNVNVLANPYVEVAPDGNGVAVKAGAVHNVTKGSVYDVFPAGTREFTAEKRRATIEIIDAGALQSVGKILDGAVAPASRAVERVHKFSGTPLRVATGDDQAFTEQIKPHLGSVAGNIEFVQTDPAAAALALRVVEAPGAVNKVAWYSPDGRQLSPAVSRDSPNAARDVAGQLQKWAKWLAVQQLSNPQSKLTASFSLTKVGEQQPTEGELLLKVGEKFRITVHNKSERDVYVHVIDLASDGSITPVFPHVGAEEKLPSGRKWTSDDFDAMLDPGVTEISDTARVLLTTEPVPIALLLQPGIKSVPSLSSKDPQSNIAQLFGFGGIEARQFGSVNVDDWKTLDRRLRVTR